MAVIDAILVAGQSPDLKVAGLAAAASSAVLELGINTIFAINGTDAFNIRFGKSGMDPASATNFRIPANTIVVFSMGQAFTHIRVFNDTASAIDVHAKQLSRF